MRYILGHLVVTLSNSDYLEYRAVTKREWTEICLNSCSTDLRYILGHSVVTLSNSDYLEYWAVTKREWTEICLNSYHPRTI